MSSEITEQFMLKVGGKSFRCECGCNVSHKRGDIYICNACNMEYSDGETAHKMTENPATSNLKGVKYEEE